MIYLDNAATTKIDDRVLEAMLPFLKENYGNAGTLYGLGRRSADAVAQARQYVADLIGAAPEQIIFTSGGTEANNMVFSGVKDYLASIGKTHIITTEIEHDSVLNAAQQLRSQQYALPYWRLNSVFGVEYISPTSGGWIDSSAVCDAANASANTGLISVMHTNNETGVENDVATIGMFCRRKKILFHTDCVQAAGDSWLDVDDIGCDFLSISAHKIHAPKGVGALYVRDREACEFAPLIFGGHEQEFGLRGGTENVAGIVGFGEACRILKGSLQTDAEYISELLAALYESVKTNLDKNGLSSVLHINGDVDFEHGKTLNLRFDGIDGETLVMMLNVQGVCVSAGSACRSHESEPSRVLLAMGISAEDARSSIRLSLSRMNTKEEVVEAGAIIASCVGMLLSGT